MEAAKKVKMARVRISARQTVAYQQEKDMDVETLSNLLALLRAARKDVPGAGQKFDGEAGDWIDVRDVFDADDMEDVEIEVQGADGKWKMM